VAIYLTNRYQFDGHQPSDVFLGSDFHPRLDDPDLLRPLLCEPADQFTR